MAQNAGRLLFNRISQRTGIAEKSDDTSLEIRLAISDQLGREEFAIKVIGNLSLQMSGGDESALIYGAGHLLRNAQYEPGFFLPNITDDIREKPSAKIRGMYLATHFSNFWEIGRLDRVREEIEELALWGANSLMAIYPVDQFTSVEGEESRSYLARLNAIGDMARSCGLEFGLVISINQNVRGQIVPPGAAFTPIPGNWSHGVELCPSNPEGRALMLRWQRQMLEMFEQLDFVVAWPYDEGGCGCVNCMPWGGNGFLCASRDFAGLVRERFPRCKIWLSTWWFDHLRDQGDFRGLYTEMESVGPPWFDGLLCGQVQLKTLARRPAVARSPVAVFPEISMEGMNPWGGFGANPFPTALGQQMAQQEGQVIGGWPYSEGLYEDINKILWLQHWWNPSAPVSAALSAYATHHLGADPKVFSELALRLEKTHERDGWKIRDLTDAGPAWTLAQSLDRSMPDRARNGWRWRIVWIRARIDALVQERGYLRALDELRPLLDELARIYEVSPASRWVVQLPVPKAGNLAFGKAVTASSVLPGNLVAPGDLVNGIDQTDSQSFDMWENDPRHGGHDWVVIDLGAAHPVAEVRMQFSRDAQYGHVFSGVPSRVAIFASTDGSTFTPVVVSDDVPREGAPYQARYWNYACKHLCRFVRFEFGASQSAGPITGRLRLAEIEVY